MFTGDQMTHEDVIKQIKDQRKPFIETIVSDDEIIRTFNPIYPEHLYKWHYDDENRIIEPLNTNDWKFQFDNEIPINIDKKIKIPQGVFHRIIKGTSILTLKITLNPSDM